ncbi:hypothetical protein CR969_00230 [Candidatus Saccharibacteria bacterium]|nr:MAG: hypothetical protein CR969_00230 [Candidatus Saccharibacteria bacterium]
MLRRKKSKKIPDRRSLAAERQTEMKAQQMASASAYRRNKTLNSRTADSPVENSERLKAHQSMKKRRRLTHILVGLGLLAVLVLIVLFQSAIQVNLQVPGAKTAKQSQHYLKIIDDYLAIRPTDRLLFLTKHSLLKQYFLDHAPEVRTVRIESGGLAKANLKLTFRQPVIQWSSGGVTYFVDDQGITFEKNYFDKPSVTVKDQSGIEAGQGQEVINRQFLSFLGRVVALFKDNNMVVDQVSLPFGTVRQVEIGLKGVSYKIKMTLDREAKPQVDQAIKGIRYIKQRGRRPAYIDVRVDQRIFYK